MKKKGFTLIELLAVIVVLAIIALIATPIVMNTIKSAKKGAAERSADSYIGAVETAVATAKLDGKDIPDGTYKIDGEGNLTGEGLPNGKLEIDMKGNKPTGGTITIKNGQVTNDSEMTVGDYDVKYNEDNKKYEASEKGNSSTEVLCKAVTSSIAGNVPQGNYANGDEYVCQVSDTQSYNFYILDSDEKKVNMIMDRNLCEDGTAATSKNKCVVSWISKEDYVAAGGEGSDYDNFLHNNKGPLTALKYLENATSSWNKLSSLNESYTDEGGVYGTILLNGKARLPKKSELKKYSTSTRYLFNNLAKYSEVTGVDNISNIEGYWVLPTIGGYTQPSRAIAVQAKYSSTLGYPDNNIVNYPTYGVRPVITLYKSQLQ